MSQNVKNLSTMQETWIWSLGQEDPLENVRYKTCIFQKRNKRKTSLNVWDTGTAGGHSEKDPSDIAIRRVIAPFPKRLWNELGQWEIVSGKNQFQLQVGTVYLTRFSLLLLSQSCIMACLRESCPSDWLLRCCCSEPHPPIDGRKGEIITFSALVLPFRSDLQD